MTRIPPAPSRVSPLTAMIRLLYSTALLACLLAITPYSLRAQQYVEHGVVTEMTSEVNGKIHLNDAWTLNDSQAKGIIFEIRNGVYLPIAAIDASREEGQNYSYRMTRVSGSLKPYVGAKVYFPNAVKKVLRGQLVVQTTPPGARIYLDGEYQKNRNTPTELDLSPGDHVVRVTYGGYAPQEKTVTIIPNQKVTAQFKLQRLEGILTIYAVPDTVTVTLTGQSLRYSGRGNTGRAGFKRRLQPGTYLIRLEKTGYEPYETTLEVTSRTPPLEVELQRPKAPVFVTSTPVGATLYLGDKEVGVTPDTLLLPMGNHQLRFQKIGYETTVRPVSVSTREPNPPLHVNLRPTDVAFYLESIPAQAQITIDGQYHGITPDTLRLMPGPHQLRLTRQDYKPYETRLNVLADSSHARYTLEPWEGILIVQTRPDSAKVFLEGEPIGITPLERRFKPGSYSLQIEKNGFEPIYRQVLISTSKTRVDEMLTPTEVTADFRSSPRGSILFLDNNNLGPTPVTESLRPGSYRVRLEKPGYLPHEETITITTDAPAQSFDFELKPGVDLPIDLDECLEKGKQFREAGQYDKAILYYSYCVSIAEVGPLRDYAIKQLERTRRMKESAAWRLAAKESIQAGRYQEALPYVNQLVDLFPDDSQFAYWKRLVENRISSDRLRGKFSIRKDHFKFKEIPIVSDLIDKSDSLRSVQDLSGISLQVASSGQGIFALKISVFTPNQTLDPFQNEQPPEVAVKNFIDADIRFGGYPLLTEWGQIGLFVGAGASFVNPTEGERKIILTIPFGFTIQVFPFRHLVLPAVAPNIPLARLGFEFTAAYSWSPFVDVTNEFDEVVEQIIYSRSQQGFGLVYRF